MLVRVRAALSDQSISNFCHAGDLRIALAIRRSFDSLRYQTLSLRPALPDQALPKLLISGQRHQIVDLVIPLPNSPPRIVDLTLALPGNRYKTSVARQWISGSRSQTSVTRQSVSD